MKTKNVCEALVPAVSVAIVDDVNPLLGLRLQNSVFGNVDKLPGVSGNRSLGTFDNVIGCCGAEPTVTIED